MFTGMVGIFAHGVFDFRQGVIDGDVYLDAQVTTGQNAGKLNGTRYTGQNLSGAVTAVFQAAATAQALAPTQTFGLLQAATTVNGNGAMNVYQHRRDQVPTQH